MSCRLSVIQAVNDSDALPAQIVTAFVSSCRPLDTVARNLVVSKVMPYGDSTSHSGKTKQLMTERLKSGLGEMRCPGQAQEK
jgi:hypothetical protein